MLIPKDYVFVYVIYASYLCPPLGFPGGSAGKESACNVGDLGSIPGSGRSPGEGKGSALQYSGLEDPMDSIVCGVAESDTPVICTALCWPLIPRTASDMKLKEE